MEFQKRRSIFRSVVVIGLSVILMGGSNSADARMGEKQSELVSALADPVSLYLPIVMKNYDARYAYKIFLPLILKQEIVINPGDWDILMTETFEGVFPNGLWVVQEKTSLGYQWGKRDCQYNTTYGGSYSAWAVGGGTAGSGLACNSHYPDNVETWMIYGPFSLADPNVQQAELVFYRYLNMQFGDEFKWMASKDGVNFYGDGTYAFEYWKKYVFNLSTVPVLGDLTGESAVYIAFVFKSNSSGTLTHGAYVDDVILQTCDGSCTPTTSAAPVSETYETSDVLE